MGLSSSAIISVISANLPFNFPSSFHWKRWWVCGIGATNLGKKFFGWCFCRLNFHVGHRKDDIIRWVFVNYSLYLQQLF